MEVKISGQDFEVNRDNLEGLRLEQGAIVGQGKLGSDLMILFHWQVARINRKQQRLKMW